MLERESGMDFRRPDRAGQDVVLAQHLEGQIERRACGRIRDLRVLCSSDLIILRGRSRTYHAKQLAQQAVLDLVGPQPMLANQIVVS